VQVIHCTKFDRAGFVGWSVNTPAWRARARKGIEPMLEGSRAATVLRELGPAPTDVIVPRSRGASPVTGTELDPVLRSLGIKLIALCGISLNIAVMTTCTESISLGYEVVVPTDAVLGFPHEYGDAMLQNSFKVMATLTSTQALIDSWKNLTGTT
jgi:nicotinamidase-related amidase